MDQSILTNDDINYKPVTVLPLFNLLRVVKRHIIYVIKTVIHEAQANNFMSYVRILARAFSNQCLQDYSFDGIAEWYPRHRILALSLMVIKLVCIVKGVW